MAIRQSKKKQSFIARMAGITPETLSRILNGRLRNPSFEIVVHLTYAAGQTVAWLLGEHGLPLTPRERRILLDAAEVIFLHEHGTEDERVLGSIVKRLLD